MKRNQRSKKKTTNKINTKIKQMNNKKYAYQCAVRFRCAAQVCQFKNKIYFIFFLFALAILRAFFIRRIRMCVVLIFCGFFFLFIFLVFLLSDAHGARELMRNEAQMNIYKKKKLSSITRWQQNTFSQML